VALRLPEHELVAHLRSMEELTACFLAGLSIVLGEVPGRGRSAKTALLLAPSLAKQQTLPEREALTEAVAHFQEQGGRANLNDWVASVEMCAVRAGYLLCGDLQTAVAVMSEEEDVSFTSLEQRIERLCSFAVSGEHLKLRQELGSSLIG
jgi:hypothetical protein